MSPCRGQIAAGEKEDWYVTNFPGGNVHVYANPDAGSGLDIGLCFLHGDGAKGGDPDWSCSRNGPGAESLFINGESGPYRIRVFSDLWGSQVGGYTLTIGQNDCGSLADAGDSFATATFISRTTSCSGGLNAYGSGTEEDWYQFPAQPNVPIEITLTPTPGLDVGLCLYRPVASGGNDWTVCSRSAGSGAPEALSAMADMAGQWRVRVLTEGFGSGRYVLATHNEPPLPSAPTSFEAATGSGTGEVLLTWQPPTIHGSSVTGYRISWGASPGGTTSTITTGNVLSLVHSGLPPGSVHYYRIAALNAYGEGPSTAEASAIAKDVVPSAPQSFGVSGGPTVTSARVSWSAPAPNGGSQVTGYRVYRGTSSGSQSFLAAPGNTWEHVDTALAPGTTYWYRVSALNAQGEGSSTVPLSLFVPTTPTAPQDVLASPGPGVGQLSVSWSPPASNGGAAVSQYVVYAGAAGSGCDQSIVGTPAATSFVHAGLLPGTQRCYRISAVNAVGEGPKSASTGVVSTYESPSAPLGLTAQRGPGVGQIRLDWQPPSSTGGTPITAMKVLRGETPGSLALLTTLSPGAITFTDAGLPNGATRWYAVRAVNAVGDGVASAPASATTFDAPTAPRALAAATGPGAGQISLAWDPPESTGGLPLDAYEVNRLTGTGYPELVATVGGGKLAWADAGLPDGATRTYFVVARNAAGSGPASASATGKSPESPSPPLDLVVATGPGAGQLTLTWKTPASSGGLPITNYRVYVATPPAAETYLASAGSALTFVHAGLPPGATRSYRVTAENSAKEGLPTDAAVGTTFALPGAPLTPATAPGPGPGMISLIWSPPASNGGLPVTRYHVYAGSPGGAADSLYEVFAPASSFVEVGLLKGVERQYRVRAVTDAGEGPPSDPALGKAPSEPPAPPAPSTTPGPAPGEITFAWTPPSGNGGLPISHYRVYVAEACTSAFVQEKEVPVGVSSFVHAGLSAGAKRCYRVTAVNDVGEGPPSFATPGTAPVPPAAPQSLAAAPGAQPFTVKLTWSPPATDGGLPLLAYRVCVGTKPDYASQSFDCRDAGLATSYVHDTSEQLKIASTTYYYHVVALNAVGKGTESNMACAHPQPWQVLETPALNQVVPPC